MDWPEQSTKAPLLDMMGSGRSAFVWSRGEQRENGNATKHCSPATTGFGDEELRMDPPALQGSLE